MAFEAALGTMSFVVGRGESVDGGGKAGTLAYVYVFSLMFRMYGIIKSKSVGEPTLNFIPR